MLRIIAGQFRSRHLIQPPLDVTRATKDRVREAVFAAISSMVVGASVLDLFAGSGAYGLEAISRGAKEAIFNDHHSEAIKAITHNVRTLGIQNASISQKDWATFIQDAQHKQLQFDLIFIDPPYQIVMPETIIAMLLKHHLFKPKAAMIVETESEKDVIPQDIFRVKTYNYGRTYIHIGWKKL